MSKTIAIIGNPNCGKSTLFNALTGSRQRIGNWPGVTVEKKMGRFRLGEENAVLVDLPGIYSLTANSVDEQIAQKFMLNDRADAIVNVIDASNIERSLYLTTQLLEMRLPVVVVLNMMDIVEQAGVTIDVERLREALQCAVLPVVATSNQGLDSLRATVSRIANGSLPVTEFIHPNDYPVALQSALNELKDRLRSEPTVVQGHLHWQAIRALSSDQADWRPYSETTRQWLQAAQVQLKQELNEDVDVVLADHRYGFVHKLTEQVVTRSGEASQSMTDRIDRVLLSPKFGVPLFFLAIYLTFMVTINLGNVFIDFFDQLTGAFLVDGLSALMRNLGAPGWLIALIAEGVGGGIQTVATFIPPIGLMFLCLSILEDSGYLPRAACVLDRAMRGIGLPGKAVIPMMVGFGCNVPAIMATRTLENHRERTLTVLMTPFMSCGARLPVYALFAAAFFSSNGQNVVFMLYLAGIALAVLTGLLLKQTLLKGEASPLLLELPLYHVPRLKSVLIHTWLRLSSFLSNAGKIIIAMVMVLSVLNSLGTDGSFGNQDSENSVLSAVGKSLTPVFSPMGIQQDNWPATVGIFTGVMAKEVIVGTLDSLYSKLAAEGVTRQAAEARFDLWGEVSAAFMTIPANLKQLTQTLTDPLGISLTGLEGIEAAAEAQDVSSATFGAMVQRFDGQAGAFAYLLFILLYFPCVATVSTIAQETGLRWATFSAVYMTGLAWGLATLYYQLMTWSRHPTQSLAWVLGILLVLGAMAVTMTQFGKRWLPELSPAREA